MVTNIQCGAPTEYSEDIQQYQMHADIFSEFNFKHTMHRKKYSEYVHIIWEQYSLADLCHSCQSSLFTHTH